MATKSTIAPRHVNPLDGLLAAADLSEAFGKAVEFSASGVSASNSQGELSFPLYAEGASGEAVGIALPGSVTVFKAGAAIAVGAELTSNGSGLWETAGSADWVTGIAISASSNSGDFIEGIVIGPYLKA